MLYVGLYYLVGAMLMFAVHWWLNQRRFAGKRYVFRRLTVGDGIVGGLAWPLMLFILPFLVHPFGRHFSLGEMWDERRIHKPRQHPRNK